jgi:hypothetical protein
MRRRHPTLALALCAACFSACGGDREAPAVDSAGVGASEGGAVVTGYVPPADAAACDPGDPDRERHGTSCLCCHTGDFTVAGSVDLGGAPVARVEVTDGFGNRSVMAPNPYGNFLRHNPLVPPLAAQVVGPDGGVRRMQMPAPHANCNECHRTGGAAAPIAGP